MCHEAHVSAGVEGCLGIRCGKAFGILGGGVLGRQPGGAGGSAKQVFLRSTELATVLRGMGMEDPCGADGRLRNRSAGPHSLWP